MQRVKFDGPAVFKYGNDLLEEAGRLLSKYFAYFYSQRRLRNWREIRKDTVYFKR